METDSQVHQKKKSSATRKVVSIGWPGVNHQVISSSDLGRVHAPPLQETIDSSGSRMRTTSISAGHQYLWQDNIACYEKTSLIIIISLPFKKIQVKDAYQLRCKRLSSLFENTPSLRPVSTSGGTLNVYSIMGTSNLTVLTFQALTTCFDQEFETI